MKLIKLSLVAALAATVMMAEDATSDLGVSANVAMTSNYVWRGMTQSADSAAIQGGFDLEYKGLYAGVWGSNVEYGTTSLEADVYVGYSNEVSGLSYDVGFIEYMYPNNEDDLNFGELYLGLGYDFGALSVGAMYSMGVDTHDSELAANDWEPTDNIELSASVPLPSDMGLDVAYGMYDKVGDYYSVSLAKTLGKFDLSVAYVAFAHDTDSDSDQDNIVATIGTSF